MVVKVLRAPEHPEAVHPHEGEPAVALAVPHDVQAAADGRRRVQRRDRAKDDGPVPERFRVDVSCQMRAGVSMWADWTEESRTHCRGWCLLGSVRPGCRCTCSRAAQHQCRTRRSCVHNVSVTHSTLRRSRMNTHNHGAAFGNTRCVASPARFCAPSVQPNVLAAPCEPKPQIHQPAMMGDAKWSAPYDPNARRSRKLLCNLLRSRSAKQVLGGGEAGDARHRLDHTRRSPTVP